MPSDGFDLEISEGTPSDDSQSVSDTSSEEQVGFLNVAPSFSGSSAASGQGSTGGGACSGGSGGGQS